MNLLETILQEPHNSASQADIEMNLNKLEIMQIYKMTDKKSDKT